MKKLLIALLLVTATLIAVVSGISAATVKYSDVKAGSWYEKSVYSATELGIMKGVSDGKFSPDTPMTRAQLVTALARMSEEDITGMGKKLSFGDTKTDAWYADSVGWAVEKNLVTGYAGNLFKPNKDITRAELATLMSKYISYTGDTFNGKASVEKFTDSAKLPGWASTYIEALRKTGLVAGDASGNFNANNGTKRSEFATIVVRYYDTVIKDPMFEKLENFYDYFEAGEGASAYLDTGTSYWITDENMGSVILPALGLDTDTYKITLNARDVAAFLDSSFGSPGYYEYFTFFRLSITNTKTGVSTETKKLKFTIRKHDWEVYADPDAFDSSLPAEDYQKMMDASLYDMGDLSRLAKAIKKAENGEDITVGYIGGSITEGAGAGSYSCYAKISANWLQKRYPDVKVNYYNAGIGGTGSALGVMRLSRTILEKDPDILFVEYAVNDGSSPESLITFESLIRTALTYKTQPAVIVLFSPPGGGQAVEAPIAAHYNLPMISAANGISLGCDMGLFTFDGDYTKDSCHPTQWGHEVYSDMIENFYRKAIEKIHNTPDSELAVKDVPENTYTSCDYMNITFTDSLNADVVSLGGWTVGTTERFTNGWKYSGEGGPLVIKFTGKHLFAIWHLISGESGQFNFNVDGIDHIVTLGPPGGGQAGDLIATLNDGGEHTLTITALTNGELVEIQAISVG